jgi:hypothetical protein
MRRLLFVFGILAVVGLAHDAGAVAHHEQVVMSQVKKGGVVVGARFKGLAIPEGYERARFNLGAMKRGPELPPTGDTTPVRHAGAGIGPGYTRAHLGEVVFDKDPAGKALPKEIDFEVTYGQGNDLQPGDVVDLVSAYNNASNAPYWHIFGMHDGPVNKGDTAHVFTLPGTPPQPAQAAPAPAQPAGQ